MKKSMPPRGNMRKKMAKQSKKGQIMDMKIEQMSGEMRKMIKDMFSMGVIRKKRK